MRYAVKGLLCHFQELHETDKIENFLGVLYEGGGERAGDGIVKTCVKHLTMKEDIGTTRRLNID